MVVAWIDLGCLNNLATTLKRRAVVIAARGDAHDTDKAFQAVHAVCYVLMSFF